MVNDEKANDGPDVAERAQKFFAAIAAEARKPSFGEMAAGWTTALLNRAVEAKLYDPTKENA